MFSDTSSVEYRYSIVTLYKGAAPLGRRLVLPENIIRGGLE